MRRSDVTPGWVSLPRDLHVVRSPRFDPAPALVVCDRDGSVSLGGSPVVGGSERRRLRLSRPRAADLLKVRADGGLRHGRAPGNLTAVFAALALKQSGEISERPQSGTPSMRHDERMYADDIGGS